MNEVMLNDIDILISRKISKSKAEKARILPFKEDGGKVYMLCELHDESICKEMQFLYGCTICEIFISNDKLKYLIKKVFFSQDNNKIEDQIIWEAIDKKASDLHFEPYKDIVYVRVRIDGILSLLYIITKEEYSAILSRIKIKSSLDITEHRRPQDGKITMDIDGNTYDLRVSIIPVVFGEKIVLRILYNNGFNYCIDNLKLLPKQRLELEKIINKNTGLVIVNGPTGSGKSTTLYTILNYVNKSEVNVVTLEDPVEVIINGVNQMMVNSKEGVSFANGLRSIMRQDPDVIMVGEVRDEETAVMAVRAALTGHKVYTTIHSTEPREVYLRLEEMGIKSYLIRESLVGIISQRLIKMLCDSCKEEEIITYRGRRAKIYKRGIGCEKCNFTGYLGRALIISINEITKDVKKKLVKIYDDNTILTNIQMVDNLNNLLINGKISRLDYMEFIDREELEFDYEGSFKTEG
ncbi:GspE/PulE family protein [Clostridium sp.]|uniref:GspE/PulE family protein n=1 Tax=Clostridium sp. TaxID=1506 RepID=UPI002E773557|nr:GspE/PulE family protein [Clostridium sp.]MEE0567606.1 GspE/PulE family protein [Clostridium sp.]